MRDEEKTTEELVRELKKLRQKVSELETQIKEPTNHEDILHKKNSEVQLIVLKTTKKALQIAKNQLKPMLDVVPGIVSWISSDLRYLGVNRKLAETFDLTPEAFVGREIGFLGTGSEFNQFVRQFFASGDQDRVQEVNSQINGNCKTYLIVAQKYDRHRAAFIVGIDITEKKQSYEQLERMVFFDGLTQIANRRYFETTLNREWRRMARVEKPLSLILCDIDYFKLYNDTYGHLSGDRCLQKIAQVISFEAKRSADFAARYGGEEFGVILPNTPSTGAAKVAENMGRAVRELQIPHIKSDVSDYVTLSLGVASFIPQLSGSPDRLITAADRALYKSKELGRDRFSIANC